MKEIAPKFEATTAEERWYSHWIQKGYFRSFPDHREPYTIVIPPPNVTGVLHMGHMLNNTIQDILIRRARMLGKNALWVPGTDHASIATEAKVVNKLKQEGIEKAQLTREEFLNHAWEWKEKHGGIILEQLKKLGASCDWDRTVFTMDEPRYESVIKVFVDLYNKGLIYRGVRMVNWDTKALTALSDEEVIYKEVNSKLYYLRYKVLDSDDEWITIATTRPETILGDTAVCVHPDDERYLHLHGRQVLVPLVNRAVPLIADEYVDREFGTGCLKITPAHDINDYTLGLKHKLDTIDIFNDNGTLSEAAGLFIGKDRFEVRELIVPELQQAGNLVKVEPYLNKVGFSERTDVVIEPKLSLQWFLKMESLAGPALEVVMNDSIAFHPPKFKNTYRHWMENVRDWCISRQLWWGHRIPAWYLPNREVVVALNATEALVKAQQQYPHLKLTSNDLRQDEDVLDTWFSSWLWPISVFDGIRNPGNPEINYYYPTNDLITAPEILFFWVARMIMAGQEYRGMIPFKNVYFTGIVRDKLGRKMSKSLGNSPDPIELIRKYGADGVRVGMLLTSPAGNDLPFDESLCEQGRNFSNKIWNALRLVTSWPVDNTLEQPAYASLSVAWFESRFNEALEQINEHFDRYRLSDALMAAYKLAWDDFCSWYLEMVKPAYQQPVDGVTFRATVDFFNRLLKILHPFMPFITEEMAHLLNDSVETDLIVAPWPKVGGKNLDLLSDFTFASEVINAIRALRQEKGISNRDKIALRVTRSEDQSPNTFDAVIAKLCNIESISYVDQKPQGAFTFIVKTTEFSVPAGASIDIAAELARLEADLAYARGFLQSVMRKLGNEKFMAGAPQQVIANELKKKADAEARIKVIEEQMASLR